MNTSPLDGFSNEYKALIKRLEHPHINQELLIKAIGKGKYASVLDATAGLGRDALVMAKVTPNLVLLERHPKMYDYLSSFFNQAKLHPSLSLLISRITLHNICAIEFLTQQPSSCFEVIYCDPMFPEKAKSALPKKDAQLLQRVVSKDEDVEPLVTLALTKASHRVVVKRPLKANALVRKPDIQYKARAHRFDVYLIHE